MTGNGIIGSRNSVYSHFTSMEPCVSVFKSNALVAPACATSTGLFDDLRSIGGFCNEHGIWLHVDAAHGASALLSERHRDLLDGIELGDSVIWDAHKLLRTSGLCAGVLVRRGEELPAAFRQSGDYLFNDNESVGFDLLDRALETTKTTMGLKLFLSLAWAGERGLGDYVASRFDAARRFHDLLERELDVICPYAPESNILCFRIGDGDQLALRDRALAEGRAGVHDDVAALVHRRVRDASHRRGQW